MSLRPSYTRFYASKWRSGTLMLSLEEEGLYIRISAFQMESGQPLPEDWKEGARLLCVQPLKYRKTIDALVSRGLIISTPEGLVCERAMLEFKRASKSVEGDKQDPPTNPRTNRDTYPDTNRGTMGVEEEKDESNQDQNCKRREEEEKKEKQTSPASLEQEPDGLAGLNGMASSMISDVIKWMVGGDEQCARTWLANTTRTYGSAITKAAYHKLGTDMLNGETFAKPLTAWCAIALRMQREEASKAVTPTIPQPSAYQAARAQIIAGALQ